MDDKIIYKPNLEDIERVRPRDGHIKISGDGVFATLQGEGITSGKPAVFLRLHFCNLACCWCDTKYTWDFKKKTFWKEPMDWTYNKTARNIKNIWVKKFGENNQTIKKRLVITGGEPLLQQDKIIILLKSFKDWHVEIETNGTIKPLDSLYQYQINCSPKLKNSRNLYIRRIKPEVLKCINLIHNSWFKFVVTEKKDLIEIDRLVKKCNLKHEKILIMPEGITVESTTSHLTIVEREVKKRGWKITQRNQLIWFGNKRKT